MWQFKLSLVLNLVSGMIERVRKMPFTTALVFVEVLSIKVDIIKTKPHLHKPCVIFERDTSICVAVRLIQECIERGWLYMRICIKTTTNKRPSSFAWHLPSFPSIIQIAKKSHLTFTTTLLKNGKPTEPISSTFASVHLVLDAYYIPLRVLAFPDVCMRGVQATFPHVSCVRRESNFIRPRQ